MTCILPSEVVLQGVSYMKECSKYVAVLWSTHAEVNFSKVVMKLW